MGNEIERLKVSIEIDPDKMKAGAEKVKKEAAKSVKTINDEFKKAQNPLHEALMNDKTMSDWKRTTTLIKSMFVDAGIGASAVTGKIRQMMQAMKPQIGKIKPTDAYQQLQKDVDGVSASVDKLHAKTGKIQTLKPVGTGRAWRSLQYDIQKTIDELDRLYAKEEQMQQKGEAGDNYSWNNLMKEISKAEKALERYQERETKMRILGTNQENKPWKFLRSDIDRTSKSMKRMGNTGRWLKGILQTLGMTARFMLASFVITGAINSAKTGLTNLAQYSDSTNASLSTLKSALTQLQNSFGTAFAPVLNVIVPILDTFLNYLATAANMVAQFMAVLTGQDSYVVAKRAATDFAASADATGASAGNAAANADKLKRSLMGFDEINKLEDQSSGSGGAAGGNSVGDMFSTEKVDNAFKRDILEWLDNLKEKAKPTTDALKTLWKEGLSKLSNFAWTAAADFYKNFLVPVGNWSLGTGLPNLINAINNFLNNVDWEKLNAALERFWKALAPFATSIGNGLIAFYEDLLSIGEKFINTVVPGGLDALSTVLEGMDAETIEKIGYALGVVATSISAIKVTNSLITKLGKLFGLFGAGVTSTAGNTGKGTSGKLLSALGDGAKWLGGKAGSTVTSLTNSSLFSGLVASLGSILPSIGGTILPAIFDEESRNYMLNQWKEFFKTYEKLWKDSGLYEKAKDFSILGGGGILSLLFGSGEKEIKVSAKDETKEGIKSAKENLDTLPNKTSVAVDADTKTADKKIGALGTIFGKKGILVGVGIKTTEKQFTPKIQKLVKNFLLGIGVDVDTDPALMWNEVKALVSGKQLGIETSVATSAPIFRGFINNLVNGWNLGVGAKIGTPAEVLQFDLQSHFKGFSAQVDAEANMKKLNDFLTTSDKTFDATANFKTGNDSLTKDKKTFETLAKFTKIEDKVPSENKFIKGILGYVNKTEAQAKKSLFLNGILGYVSNVQTQLNKGLSLKGILGYISEVKKDTSVASLILKGITGFVSALGGTEKANGGVFSGGSWKPITAYAGGGLPSQGQMFVAREAGPELVGTLGGHTAVMNNNQIVSSVSDGVYHAVAAAMSQFTGQMNGGGTPNITVYVGGRQVTDVVVEEVNQRTKATGMCPIMV